MMLYHSLLFCLGTMLILRRFLLHIGKSMQIKTAYNADFAGSDAIGSLFAMYWIDVEV